MTYHQGLRSLSRELVSKLATNSTTHSPATLCRRPRRRSLRSADLALQTKWFGNGCSATVLIVTLNADAGGQRFF
jgi:hypothetical protein